MKQAIVVSFLVVFFTVRLSAQVKRGIDRGEIEDAEIIVEKNKQIDLPEAARNFEKIIVPPRPKNIVPQTYQFSHFTPSLPAEAVKYPAKMVSEEPLDKLYNGFIRAAGGNYQATWLEGFFHQKRSQNNDYGIHLRHNAFGKGAVRNAGNSDNSLRAFVAKNTGKIKLSAEGNMRRERYHFFGYDQKAPANDKITADSVKQIFHTFQLAAGAENSSENKLHYQVKAGFRRLTDRFQVAENEIEVLPRLVYALSPTTGVQVRSDISFSTFKDSSSLTRAFIPIQSAYYYETETLRLLAGGRVVFNNDTISPEKNVRLFPLLRADYTIIKNQFSTFLQIEGNTLKRTYQSFVQENPFLAPHQILAHTQQRIGIEAGATANLQALTVQLRGGYATFSQLPFYINQFPDSSKFVIVYEKENVGRAELNLQASYRVANTLQIGADFTLHHYHFTQQDSLNSKRAYHRPTQMASFWLNYNLKNKIFIQPSWQYMAGITALNVNTGKNLSLPAISDIDLQIDYRFSEKFAIFIHLDNLISQKNQRYLYYTNRGFTLLGGLTYSF